jgi:hypothetical protein
MSGFDKFHATEELLAKGWTKSVDGNLRPPASLIAALVARTYDVYEARELQEFVDPPEGNS